MKTLYGNIDPSFSRTLIILCHYFPRCNKRKTITQLTALTLISFVAIVTWRTNQGDYNTSSSDEIKLECQTRKRLVSFVYKNGGLHCLNITKYLSYQPPGGGWNNQRIALENAVIIAWLLGRTLLLQPLAPHDEMLKHMVRWNRSAGYTVYNMLHAQQLVPLSNIIDIKQLSFLVPVKEIRTSHTDFIKEYSKSHSWYNVCCNGLAQAWIDELPFDFIRSEKNMNIIHNITSPRELANIPKHRRVCITKGQKNGGIWEFLINLRKQEEQMIYFEKGSLFVRSIFFTNKKRALRAQRAVVDFIQPARDIVYHVINIINMFGKPFNAIHVRRTDHKTGTSLPLQHWLSKLTEANALQHSKNLYVATDEVNSTWFQPLVNAGYQVYLARDFEIFKKLYKSNSETAKDIVGIHEQMICSLAKIFIPSYYSTFSWIIERQRQARRWNRETFRNLKHSSVKWLDMQKVMRN